MQVPLFPLNVVLYPGGPLPLRIFESRYIDMIGERMRNDAPFGVLLIREGVESGGSASTWDIGTLAKIVDFYQGSDGLLGVTAIGGQRFRLRNAERAADGLNVGEIELLPDEPRTALPDDFQPLAEILAGVLDDLGKLYENLPRQLDDAGWVANRFLEILPIRLEEKQELLANDDALLRLDFVSQVLNSVKPTQ